MGEGREWGGKEGREASTWGQPGLSGGAGVEGDDEGAVARCELLGVVPFLVGGCTIPYVDGLPEGVIA